MHTTTILKEPFFRFTENRLTIFLFENALNRGVFSYAIIHNSEQMHLAESSEKHTASKKVVNAFNPAFD